VNLLLDPYFNESDQKDPDQLAKDRGWLRATASPRRHL